MSSLRLLVTIFALQAATVGVSEETCPVTVGKHNDDAPFPEFLWYGDENLSVTTTPGGVCYTHRHPTSLSLKVFWWSKRFEIGMEPKLVVTAEHISGEHVPPRITRVTNAYREELESTGPWAMLTGLSFERPGCWKIIGEFEGERLSFIMQVKDIGELSLESDLE